MKATTVTASITPNPSRRGSIRKHIVRCDVTLSHYDNIGSITLALLTPESSSEASGIATVLHYSGRSRQQWETDSHLKRRGTLDGSVEEGYIALRLRDTLCSDDNQGYKCIVMYYRDAVWKKAVSTTTQSVRGQCRLRTSLYTFIEVAQYNTISIFKRYSVQFNKKKYPTSCTIQHNNTLSIFKKKIKKKINLRLHLKHHFDLN